ncbi:hypothetical protein bcgnr5372_38800 [Bacillus luti]|nr:hypothetical protein [Bacillus cereus]HDR8330713.1 hypothetical protein [Bacillus cereus]HDR8336450.1 hypothetical protein [Bacillus cereus]
MKLTKKTKAVILTGVLALSIGALSGCSSKHEAQSKNETTVLAESEKVVEVHGAEIVKENLLQFLQMDSKEAESFAKKNISNKIKTTEIEGPLSPSHMSLESDFTGLQIYTLYNLNKNARVGFSAADDKKAIANSFEEAQSLLGEYGVSAKWEKDNNEESKVATKESRGRHYFTSNIEDKPVNVTVSTDLQENTETVTSISVSLKK